MTVLRSSVDRRSAGFQANRDELLAMLAEVREQTELAAAGGGERYVTRHQARGKLLARDRIELLLDPESAFLELSPLAGHSTGDPLGGGVITGIGVVSGTECLITANDPTVRGGSSSPTTVTKLLRANEIALQNRLPVINLTESAGADLPRQADIFVPGGAMFRQLTQLSAAGIPTVTLVFGPSTAGGAYVPGMSDYVVMVRKAARVYLGGPPLVKMAIDEDANDEDLGGAEMHARTSGLADHLAEDEADALRIGRQIISHLRWAKQGPGPSQPADPPIYDPEELLGVASADVRRPFDIREVIARVVDGSRFEEFKPLYGTTLVTGWASIHGYPVGLIANNGILFAEESRKSAQFIQLCNRTDTPIVFVQNITGFMVGTRYEQGGIIKAGAQLINAVSNSTVPHFTLMVGASYGAGNYGMSGRAFNPRLIFSWPQHKIAVMGAKQMGGVLGIIRRTAAESAGREVDEAAETALRDAVEAQIESESTALFATGRLWDDGIIDPRDTRTVLGLALSAAASAPVAGTKEFGVFRL